MKEYTIYCTLEQTKKAFELGAPLKEAMSKYNAKLASQNIADGKKSPEEYARENVAIISSKYSAKALSIPTAEQMIGFIIESGRGYSTDLSELIKEQGYKQGCLTFIDNCLK